MTASTYADRINGITTSEAIKAPVDVATTANITLSGAQTVDGEAVTTGHRVLAWQQDDNTENGIYDASTTTWTRALDFNGTGDAVEGTLVWVRSGDTYADGFFQLTTTDDPIVLGTSAITFAAADVFAAEAAQAAAEAAQAAAETAEANAAASAAAAAADKSAFWCGTAGGTKNALTLTPSPAITAYAAGQSFRFKTGATASDGAVTFEVSGLPAKAGQMNGAAMSASVYMEDDKWYEAYYTAEGVFEVSKIGVFASIFSQTLMDDATAEAARATLGVAIGTDVQAHGATLDSLEGLTLEAGDVLYATAPDTLTNLAKGTAAQVLTMNSGATAPEWAAAAGGTTITIGTPVATTSGTSVDITGITAGAKRITFGVNGVSTSGTSPWELRLGDSGGVEAADYYGSADRQGTTFTTSTGAVIPISSASQVIYAGLTLTRIHPTNHTWLITGIVGIPAGSSAQTAYIKTLTGELTTLSLTTNGGSDTFDLGEIVAIVEV